MSKLTDENLKALEELNRRSSPSRRTQSPTNRTLSPTRRGNDSPARSRGGGGGRMSPPRSPARSPRPQQQATPTDIAAEGTGSFAGNDSMLLSPRGARGAETASQISGAASSVFTMRTDGGGSPRTKQGVSQNVRAMVRIRPFNSVEWGLGDASQDPPVKSVVFVKDTTEVNVLDPDRDWAPKEAFIFDNVFWSLPDSQNQMTMPGQPFATQETVFEVVGVEAIDAVLEGRNCCVFAYGQTSSGKTHTMLGNKADPGLIPRIIERLFDMLSGAPAHMEYVITASFMEIYNEKVKDLLDAAATNTMAKDGSFCDRKVRFSPEFGTFVEGLRRTVITSAAQCEQVITAGTSYRTTASTNMNDTSSRSHAILQLSVRKKDVHLGVARSAILNLVDLAGSERIRMSGVTGSGLTEAKNINQSLSSLRRVIDTLLDNATRKKGGRMVVPYRESVLTWVLSDSLGGNCLTTMLGTCSPHARNIDDTVSTLRYCVRARAIVCNIKVNEEKCQVVVGAIKKEMESMKAQMEEDRLRREIEEAERERQAEEAVRRAEELEREKGTKEKKNKAAAAVLTSRLEKLRKLQEELGTRERLASQAVSMELQRSEMVENEAEAARRIEQEIARVEALKAEMAILEDQSRQLELDREEAKRRKEAAVEERRRVHQRELAGIFRMATKYGRDKRAMAAVRKENDDMRRHLDQLGHHLERRKKKRALAATSLESVNIFYSACRQREKDYQAAMNDTVEFKNKRIVSERKAHAQACADLEKAKADMATVKADIERMYAMLDEDSKTLRAACAEQAKNADRSAVDLESVVLALDSEMTSNVHREHRNQEAKSELEQLSATYARLAQRGQELHRAEVELKHTCSSIAQLRHQETAGCAAVEGELDAMRTEFQMYQKELQGTGPAHDDLQRFVVHKMDPIAVDGSAHPQEEQCLHLAHQQHGEDIEGGIAYVRTEGRRSNSPVAAYCTEAVTHATTPQQSLRYSIKRTPSPFSRLHSHTSISSPTRGSDDSLGGGGASFVATNLAGSKVHRRPVLR